MCFQGASSWRLLIPANDGGLGGAAAGPLITRHVGLRPASKIDKRSPGTLPRTVAQPPQRAEARREPGDRAGNSDSAPRMVSRRPRPTEEQDPGAAPILARLA